MIVRFDADGAAIRGKIEALSGKIGGFDIQSNYLSYNGQTWGGTICMLIGLVMLIAGVYKAAKKLIQGQAGGQTSWVTVGLLIMFGAVLLAGGFGLVNSIGTGLGDTLKALGEG